MAAARESLTDARRRDFRFDCQKIFRRPCERRDPYAVTSMLRAVLKMLLLHDRLFASAFGGYGSLRSQGRR
jgi:hypothetical protein